MIKYTLLYAGLLVGYHASAAEELDPVAATLRTMQPAGSSCGREEDAAQSAGVVRARIPELSCALPASELSALQARSSVHVIDTRPASQYSQAHIDAALNLSWGEVRVRNYLKSKPIVLMGSGKDDESLYAGCAELEAAGFNNVRVVRGGYAAWIAAGLPLVGAPVASADAMALNDEQLMNALAFTANIVFAWPEAKEFVSINPRVMTLNGANGNAIRQKLAERASQVGSAPFASLVLLTGRAPTETQLAELVRSAHPHPVLIYTGSAERYSAFVRSKNAEWVAHARGPKGLPCSTR